MEHKCTVFTIKHPGCVFRPSIEYRYTDDVEKVCNGSICSRCIPVVYDRSLA
jgi:hypothetical protein